MDGLKLSAVREAEIVEELSQHLDDRYRELTSGGLDRRQAITAVLEELDGNQILARELRKVEKREYEYPVMGQTRRATLMRDFIQDVRYGLRMLVKAPSFTAVALLSLALGIGANTAIFQLFDAVFLRTLPVASPEQIAEISFLPQQSRTGNFRGDHPKLTYAQWKLLRERQQVFSGIFAWGSQSLNLAPQGEVRYARALWVSGNFFSVLGVNASIGRTFSDADDREGCGTPGVVLSHAFWQREFGADPSAVGKTLTLEGHTVNIIGVAPESFTGLDVGRSFDLALPICFQPTIEPEHNLLQTGWSWWLDVMGRLKPGVTIEQANAHICAIGPGILRDSVPSKFGPDGAKEYLALKWGVSPAGSGISTLRDNYQTPFALLMCLAGLVLLIACGNIANLLLARASSREKEIAIRLALGASRSRLARQLLSESLLLAILGAVAGAALGSALSGTLVALLSTKSKQVFVDLKADWRVIAFTSGLALVTCLLFGLAPAIRASRNSAAAAMKSTGRGLTASRERFGLRRGLVVVQVALSLVLLVGAVLFSGSLRKLLTLDAGFRENGILYTNLDFSGLKIAKDQRLQYQRQLEERVRAIPEIDSAAAVNIAPLTGGGWNERVEVEGYPLGKAFILDFNRVAPGYFTAMSVPLVAGRDFDERTDTEKSAPVAIVNQAFAKRLPLNGVSPLGLRVSIPADSGDPRQTFQIVGLVGDTLYTDIHEPPPPICYVAMSQDPDPGENVQIAMHCSKPLSEVVPAVKAAVAEVNPGITLDFQVLSTVVKDSLVRERLLAVLSGFFGLLGVLLACIGLYGVMSFGVSTRTNEIGVRMALGARRFDVTMMVLRESLALVIAGILIGLPAIFASKKLISSLLFGLSPTDAGLISLAVVALAAAAGAAAYFPARRASRTDPMNALRYE